jgi:hypothetical protein
MLKLGAKKKEMFRSAVVIRFQCAPVIVSNFLDVKMKSRSFEGIHVVLVLCSEEG